MKGDARKRAIAAAKSNQSASSDVSAQNQSSCAPENARHKLDKSGLYDLQQVKRLLDDEVMAFMDDQGYAENTLVSNIKILAGSLAVVAAVYSHFGPGEFPANKPVIFACVAFYLFCMCLINVSSFIFEASAVFVGSLTPSAKQDTQAASLATNICVLTSYEHKGSSAYRVEIRTSPRRKLDAVSSSHSYDKYITEEGRFLPDVLRADLQVLLAKVATGAKKTN